MFLIHAVQKLIVGFEGTDPEHPCVQKMIRYGKEGKITGVILFARNIYNHGQLKNLTKALKEAGLEVCSDEEGKRTAFKGVSRLYKLVGPVPTAYQMARSYSPQQAYVFYRNYARRLKELGITMVFGPVLDLHCSQSQVIAKYERAYSKNPYTVCRYAKVFIKAFADEGIKTVVKHYPGHGLVAQDTHYEITNITKTYQFKESIPFRRMARYTPYVMMGHLIDDTIDPNREASLSSIHYEKVYKMGYRFIITDDMDMGAMQLKYQPIQCAIKKALHHGATVIVSNMPKAIRGFFVTPDFDLPEKLKE